MCSAPAHFPRSQAAESSCKDQCYANRTEICGDNDRLSVYATGQRGHWGQLVFTAVAQPSQYVNGTYASGSLVRHAVLTGAGGKMSNTLGAGLRFLSDNVLVEHVCALLGVKRAKCG